MGEQANVSNAWSYRPRRIGTIPYSFFAVKYLYTCDTCLAQRQEYAKERRLGYKTFGLCGSVSWALQRVHVTYAIWGILQNAASPAAVSLIAKVSYFSAISFAFFAVSNPSSIIYEFPETSS